VVINGFTFAVDLALLTGFHGALHWPVPLAITGSYAVAIQIVFEPHRPVDATAGADGTR
jgi:hypothetical protein